jgi:hypothetical protein
MLKRSYFLLGLVVVISLLAGCSGSGKAAQTTQTVPAATLGTQLTFSPGQTITIASESMDIKFVNATNDTRCPTGEICASSGQVMANIKITQNGNTNDITMTDIKGSGATDGYIFQNYKMLYAITPYPASGTLIDPKDYRLTLTITKQ